MRDRTYMPAVDSHGMEHMVGQDGRTMCGYLHSARQTYYGFGVGGLTPENEEPFWHREALDCPRCQVQLHRVHGW